MNNEKLISCPHDNPNVYKQSSLYAYNRAVSSDVIGCNIGGSRRHCQGGGGKGGQEGLVHNSVYSTKRIRMEF